MFIYSVCTKNIIRERDEMAKPIEPTPTLRGEDARRFLDNMYKEQTNPGPKRLEVLRKAREAAKHFIIEY